MQWPRAFILDLSGCALAQVVGPDHPLVLDADDGHATGGRPEMRVAGLAHARGGLVVRALATRAPFGGMDAGESEELVEVAEAEDVADLREEGRRDRRTDRRDRPQRTRRLAVEDARDPPIGILDLALEQVVLVEHDRRARARRRDRLRDRAPGHDRRWRWRGSRSGDASQLVRSGRSGGPPEPSDTLGRRTARRVPETRARRAGSGADRPSHVRRRGRVPAGY